MSRVTASARRERVTAVTVIFASFQHAVVISTRESTQETSRKNILDLDSSINSYTVNCKTLAQLNGKWSCISVALFHSTDLSKHFTTLATFNHSHTHSYTDGIAGVPCAEALSSLQRPWVQSDLRPFAVWHPPSLSPCFLSAALSIKPYKGQNNNNNNNNYLTLHSRSQETDNPRITK